MSVLTSVPEPNLWNEICKEHQSKRPPFTDPDLESVTTDLQDYDPSKHCPVFYGQMHGKIEMTDDDVFQSADPAISHPAALGYAFVERPPASPPSSPPPPPDHRTCSPREYLEAWIFPTLLPALEEMLKQAKKERCFERKRTRFNALDFLTEYLYKNNPLSEEQRDEAMTFLDIDFVKEHLEKYPRAPLPLSLLWSEEEATLVAQSFWRGFLVRRDPEVQELRQWQKAWREEHEDVNSKVNDFWASKMPSQPGSSLLSDDVSAHDGDVTAASADVAAARAAAAIAGDDDATAQTGDVADMNGPRTTDETAGERDPAFSRSFSPVDAPLKRVSSA